VFKGVKIISHVDGHKLTQYVLIQESLEDDYVNEELGINFRGRFATITLEEDGALRDVYIGSGHRLSYKGFTVTADKTSHAVFLEN